MPRTNVQREFARPEKWRHPLFLRDITLQGRLRPFADLKQW